MGTVSPRGDTTQVWVMGNGVRVDL